jgi:hypothetical protein
METTTINISGYDVIIDVEDLERVEARHWYLYDRGMALKHNKYYFRADIRTNDTLYRVTLHRFLLGCVKGDGVIVDHIDRDTFNCSKSNLRKCTHAQNAHNSAIARNNTSGYKGVSRNTSTGQWEAYIGCRAGGKTYLGTYMNAVDAARAYDIAALYLRHEYAALNFLAEDYTGMNLAEEYKSCLPKKMSKYKGVSRASNGQYQAHISYNHKKYYLGRFYTEEEAYAARLAKEKELGLDFS